MNMREGILDALVDDVRTSALVQNYLEIFKINFTKESLIHELVTLLAEGKIYIGYPPHLKNQRIINFDEIEDYWFELTQEGRAEWDKIET